MPKASMASKIKFLIILMILNKFPKNLEIFEKCLNSAILHGAPPIYRLIIASITSNF